MHEGVKLLMARMESHPEEFYERYTGYGDTHQWWGIFSALARRGAAIEGKQDPDSDNASSGETLAPNPFTFLTDEEVKMLLGKYRAVQSEGFTADIMKNILRVSEDRDARVGKAVGSYNSTGVSPAYTTGPGEGTF